MTNNQADALTQLVTWIPVSERLPKHGQTVQVAWKHYEDNPITLGYWNEIQKSWYSGYVTASRDVATHWAETLKHPSELKTTRAPEPEGERLTKIHALQSQIRPLADDFDEMEAADLLSEIARLSATPTAQPEAEPTGEREIDTSCWEPKASKPTAGSGEGEAVSDGRIHKWAIELYSTAQGPKAYAHDLIPILKRILTYATSAAEQAKAQAEQERDDLALALPLSTNRTREQARTLLGMVSRHSDGDLGASHGCVDVANARSVIDTLVAERDQAEQRAQAVASAIRAKLSGLPYSLRQVEPELDQLTREGRE